jgi:restriction endonuclease S subunit
MIERKITNTIKDERGKIVALANPVEWWSPRTTAEVINDIEEIFYEYYLILDGQKVLLKVMNGTGEKRLRTDPNLTLRNRLIDLPGF